MLSVSTRQIHSRGRCSDRHQSTPSRSPPRRDTLLGWEQRQFLQGLNDPREAPDTRFWATNGRHLLESVSPGSPSLGPLSIPVFLPSAPSLHPLTDTPYPNPLVCTARPAPQSTLPRELSAALQHQTRCGPGRSRGRDGLSVHLSSLAVSGPSGTGTTT